MNECFYFNNYTEKHYTMLFRIVINIAEFSIWNCNPQVFQLILGPLLYELSFSEAKHPKTFSQESRETLWIQLDEIGTRVSKLYSLRSPLFNAESQIFPLIVLHCFL